MNFREWEPTYREILASMGYDPMGDDTSARVAMALMQNMDLIDADALGEMIGDAATVIGDAPRLDGDLRSPGALGTVLCAGSAVGRAMAAGILPDIVVTDLDGDIGPQMEASARGSVTLVHAHGDNAGLIQRHVRGFRGRIMLTTQSEPRGIAFCFGGFTDGDRAVCVARHFGARRIRLLGFDFSGPRPKEGCDPSVKLRKLAWAERIIFSGGGEDIEMPGGAPACNR